MKLVLLKRIIDGDTVSELNWTVFAINHLLWAIIHLTATPRGLSCTFLPPMWRKVKAATFIGLGQQLLDAVTCTWAVPSALNSATLNFSLDGPYFAYIVMKMWHMCTAISPFPSLIVVFLPRDSWGTPIKWHEPQTIGLQGYTLNSACTVLARSKKEAARSWRPPGEVRWESLYVPRW